MGHSQIIFNDNFNDGDLNGWTNVDDDSDNTSIGVNGKDYDLWYTTTDYNIFVPNSDGFSAASSSLATLNGSTFQAFSPNNFLISPAIDLTSITGSNLNLSFRTGSGQATGGHAEHYAVYVTTSNVPATIINSTPVFEETLPSGEMMFSHVFDISSYIGQTVYVTFRHFNCTNQLVLLLDDVKVENLYSDNAKIEKLNLNRYSLTNTNNTLGIVVKNEGENTINSLTIEWNDGAPHTQTLAVNIPTLATATVNHTDLVNYATIVEKNLDITITQVNGNIDPVVIGNTSSIMFNTISQSPAKSVLFEEGTGTWCPTCPAGTVDVEDMLLAHPTNFIPVAVHYDDPMEDTEYRTGADLVALPGYNIDRVILKKTVTVAPSSETIFNERVILKTPASLNYTTTKVGNNLTIDVTAKFFTNFSNANFRLGVIIAEDNVTGTTSQYNQANVYAGGTYGPMGNYHNLPNPVPASQMVYNHVGRALLGGYNGQVGSVPSSITDGQEVNYTFNYTAPSGVDVNNVHAVIVLIDQSTGEVLNATNQEGATSGVAQLELFDMKVFPNPADDILKLSFDANSEEYVISIFTMSGQEVLSTRVNNLKGNHVIEIPVSNLSSGQYLLTVSTNGQSSTKQISIR